MRVGGERWGKGKTGGRVARGTRGRGGGGGGGRYLSLPYEYLGGRGRSKEIA